MSYFQILFFFFKRKLEQEGNSVFVVTNKFTMMSKIVYPLYFAFYND